VAGDGEGGPLDPAPHEATAGSVPDAAVTAPDSLPSDSLGSDSWGSEVPVPDELVPDALGSDVLAADSVAAEAMAGLAAAVDELLAVLPTVVADESVLELLRRGEVVSRRLAAGLDGWGVAELDVRGVPDRYVARSTADLLGGLLRLSPSEARRRVVQARLLAPRAGLSAGVLEPELPVLSAARHAGEVAVEQVGLIAATVRALPASVPVTVARLAERLLTGQARLLDAHALRVVCRRLIDTLDPDGRFTDDADRQRRRDLSITALPDGMYRLRGDLDPETGALTQSLINALAAPQPPTAPRDGQTGNNTSTDADDRDDDHTGDHPGGDSDDDRGDHTGADDTGDDSSDSGVTSAGASGGATDPSVAGTETAAAAGAAGGVGGVSVRDLRSPGQRRHDAWRVAVKRLLAAGGLPLSGGLPATVLITMTAEQYAAGRGIARTSYGDPIEVGDALRLADEALIGWVVQDQHGKVLRYGQTRRIATAHQTRALIARDRGCAFPGCAAPPEWSERHHVVAWRHGGGTDLDNLCLLCDWHHDQIDRHGWRVTMRNGRPEFTPPRWRDPHQRPRRNHRC
jgi:hypothetical protein